MGEGISLPHRRSRRSRQAARALDFPCVFQRCAAEHRTFDRARTAGRRLSARRLPIAARAAHGAGSGGASCLQRAQGQEEHAASTQLDSPAGLGDTLFSGLA